MKNLKTLITVCYFSFGFILSISSQSSVKQVFNSLPSSKIVKDLVNEMRTKMDLSELTENNELNQAAAYHGILFVSIQKWIIQIIINV